MNREKERNIVIQMMLMMLTGGKICKTELKSIIGDFHTFNFLEHESGRFMSS